MTRVAPPANFTENSTPLRAAIPNALTRSRSEAGGCDGGGDNDGSEMGGCGGGLGDNDDGGLGDNDDGGLGDNDGKMVAD
jgi:hypothetical protein